MKSSVSPIVRIAQISDTHIGNFGALVQGVDVRANFLRVLHAVKKAEVDLLVISGDLAAYEGETEAYQFLDSVLQTYESPWCCIAGNHDITQKMVRLLRLQPEISSVSYYYQREIKNRSVFFLDSSSGYVSEEQLFWLKEETAKISEEVLLFMHHPPCLCNHQFMDAFYSLHDMETVQRELTQIKNLHHIFTGHYHAAMHAMFNGINVYVTPSTHLQLDNHGSEFKISSLQPAWRLIEWGTGSLKTSVHFL